MINVINEIEEENWPKDSSLGNPTLLIEKRFSGYVIFFDKSGELTTLSYWDFSSRNMTRDSLTIFYRVLIKWDVSDTGQQFTGRALDPPLWTGITNP